jgi:hypothetical protein
MADIVRRIAENKHAQAGAMRAAYNTHGVESDLNLPPVFQRWVVLDVIFDPFVIDQNKILYLESIHGMISNVEYAQKFQLPRNTIIARPIIHDQRGNRSNADYAMFLYPMFPSSLSMPCKPGEHVWVMFEDLTENKDLGYWICGIVGPGHVEDANHSHAPREFDASFSGGIGNNSPKDLHENKKIIPRYHFKNGIYTKIATDDEGVIVDPKTAYISGDKDAYEKILNESDASKAMIYEPVPRFKKRPGDIALEGSNNALIVLGTDRKNASVNWNPNEKQDELLRTVIPSLPDGENASKSGAIDIVAGRGVTPATGGKVASPPPADPPPPGQEENFLLYRHDELAKDLKSVVHEEGNPDFKNDRSRIYVAQNTKVNRKIGGFYSARNQISFDPPLTDSADGDAGIIIKSDKVRIIARSDVQIMVMGFTSDPNSPNIKNENENDAMTWASVTIKQNGDIVFTPSEKGYIKLGDDKADKAILCTDVKATTVDGKVTFKPGIITTGADVVGTGVSGQGTFSTKVLVK